MMGAVEWLLEKARWFEEESAKYKEMARVVEEVESKEWHKAKSQSSENNV